MQRPLPAPDADRDITRVTLSRPLRPSSITPAFEGTDWIDSMPDDQCMEVFWLYVDPPEAFLAQYDPALLGAAMRRALREVASGSG